MGPPVGAIGSKVRIARDLLLCLLIGSAVESRLVTAGRVTHRDSFHLPLARWHTFHQPVILARQRYALLPEEICFKPHKKLHIS